MEDPSPSHEVRPNRSVFHRSLIATCIAALLFAYPTAHSASSQAYPNGPAVAALDIAAAPVPPTIRTVNAPYFGPGSTFNNGDAAIFWFGQVRATENYADVRVGYNDTELIVYLAVFDNYLWSDDARDVSTLEKWDASTLYLDTTAGPVALSLNSYKFAAQIANSTVALRRDSRGNGTAWTDATLNITAKPGWRGQGFNQGQDSRGWTMLYRVPFASLGLTKPAPGTAWRMGVAVHDRDDAAGTPIANKTWPEGFADAQPNSWGRLVFGLPSYAPPGTANNQSVEIAHKRNGAVVADGQVGGGAICGTGVDFWTQWGEVVDTVSPNINVQNQVDVADWPCFSKYYVTFPLTQIPAGQIVVSASLTLWQMGNAGAAGEAKPSLIQIMTLAEDWNPSTLSWNTAPLALENVSRARVDPMPPFTNWDNVPARTWDLSYAVAQAYASGRPLRLALYSADEDYHSGKYFVTSDTGDWNERHRPVLKVSFGTADGSAPPPATATPTAPPPPSTPGTPTPTQTTVPTAGPSPTPTSTPRNMRPRAYLPSLEH